MFCSTVESVNFWHKGWRLRERQPSPPVWGWAPQIPPPQIGCYWTYQPIRRWSLSQAFTLMHALYSILDFAQLPANLQVRLLHLFPILQRHLNTRRSLIRLIFAVFIFILGGFETRWKIKRRKFAKGKCRLGVALHDANAIWILNNARYLYNICIIWIVNKCVMYIKLICLANEFCLKWPNWCYWLLYF